MILQTLHLDWSVKRSVFNGFRVIPITTLEPKRDNPNPQPVGDGFGFVVWFE